MILWNVIPFTIVNFWLTPDQDYRVFAPDQVFRVFSPDRYLHKVILRSRFSLSYSRS